MKVQMDIPEGLQALAEPELLARSLGNVLRNAIRYAPTASPITIAARAENDRVFLSVVDCGPGVPPESLSKLFDPFLSRGQLADAADGRSGFGSGDCSNLRGSVWRSVRARNRESGGLEVTLYLAIAEPRVSSVGSTSL